VTEDPGDKQIEVAEQELIEGKCVYPFYLVFLNHLGSFAIALHGFGITFHHIHVPVILLFYSCSCQDH
jgi:hypothetical protein